MKEQTDRAAQAYLDGDYELAYGIIKEIVDSSMSEGMSRQDHERIVEECILMVAAQFEAERVHFELPALQKMHDFPDGGEQ